jgi:putative ABC transport system permease protein
MFKNFFRIIFRNLSKNKTYSVITILGLALGMAAFMLIMAYVRFEHSFDTMHQEAANIYRVESLFFKNGDVTDHWPTSTNGYAKAMKDNFPEVKTFTRIDWHNSERVVKYNEIKFREQHVCFADSNFFSFFSYPLVKGDINTTIKDANTVAISASAAQKYFGSEEPVGKFLDISTISDHFHCMVTGIFKDIPANSTMQFNLLMSWNTLPEWQKDFWYMHESYTFIKLNANSSVTSVEEKFPALAEKYKTGPALKELKWSIELVPLKDIHLNPAKPYEIETKGNRQAVIFLYLLAFVIIIIAWVNYCNLSTAKAIDRAKEVGIRKVSGANQSQLVIQFLFESFLLNGIAWVIAVILTATARFFLARFIGNGISYGLLFDRSFYIEFAVVLLTGILLSGIYPALVLARLKPMAVLKGKYAFSKTGTLFRKGLVTIQFASSLVLITGTFAVYKQIIYMGNQNTGVKIDQTIVMKSPVNTPEYKIKNEFFKNSVKDIPGVFSITGSGAVPGKEVGEFLANRRFGAPKTEERTYEMLKVDYDFIKTYNLDLIAGRGFDKSVTTDSFGLVLNESAVKQFGFASAEDAIGQKIWVEANKGNPNEVIGIIKDYHQQSLQQKYTALVLFMDPAYNWIPVNYYSVRVNKADVKNIVAGIRKKWEIVFPESSFDFFFLDEFYDRQYRQDKQFGHVFLLFSSLAIFIACMGLFGLTAYSTARRTREIGVRKVLGASVRNIISLLAWDSVKLVLVSGIIALPLAYLFVQQWLQSYAFRSEISWEQFLIPLLLLLLIAIITISWLTWTAALRNPALTLKEE